MESHATPRLYPGMTRGSRKLLVCLVGFGIAALVPLTETQADVILGLAYGMMGVNAVEHIGGAIRGKADLRPDGRSGGGCGPAGSAK